jgi:hypothetical protein
MMDKAPPSSRLDGIEPHSSVASRHEKMPPSQYKMRRKIYDYSRTRYYDLPVFLHANLKDTVI